MTTPEEYFPEFFADAEIRAQAQGDFMQAAFFEMYEEIASENGDVESLDYTPYKATGMQIDGYHFDPESGVFTLAISDFRAEKSLQGLNTADIIRFFKRAETFVEKATNPDFLNKLEETSPGFQVAYFLHSEINHINRIRFLLLSNAKLVSRLPGLKTKKVKDKSYSFQVLDFGRYFDIVSSRSGHEPVEVDITELEWEPLPFLKASSGSEDYSSYLLAVPAELLARIYVEYGARLLEQNVRTFLQARGKVNKGIIRTLKDEPQMFFAYNNGLTATAGEVKISRRSDGSEGISVIRNLQIVNGGQTTASMLYARDKDKSNLSNAYVQMKLSVVSEDKLDYVVPNISRFANTQNKVSEADFFSNHPFHVRIEEFSRRIPAPSKEGQFHQTKWFYERARGQYRDRQAYLTDARRRQFQTEFPKDQVITKTDLAKYLVSFDGEPHIVSMGAQKNFLKFATGIAKQWEKSEIYFNEQWYREMISKAIVFRTLDRFVMKAEWYEGGYKANIVTYSIAWLAHYVKTEKKAVLDFTGIWTRQELGPDLLALFSSIAPAVAKEIENTPENVRNVTEWCKKQACWDRVSKITIDLPAGHLKSCLVSETEAKQQKTDAQATQKIDNEVSNEVRIYQLGPEWKDIQDYALSNKLITPAQDQAISVLLRGRTPTSVHMKKLSEVLSRVEEDGYKFSSDE